MWRHCHLGFHIVGRSVEDNLPTRDKELLLLLDTSLYDWPYFAAQDLRCNMRISENPKWVWFYTQSSKITEYALELTLFLALYLPSHIPQQPLENVHPFEVVHKPCILGFALLNEVVFVENGLQNNILLIEQTVDSGSIMKAKSVGKSTVVKGCQKWSSKAGYRLPPKHEVSGVPAVQRTKRSGGGKNRESRSSDLKTLFWAVHCVW